MTALDVVTPAAVVDIDRLEANIGRWQDHCDRVGLANRPHVKTHKCIEIAHRQIQVGAIGITCQTLHEAEVMVTSPEGAPLTLVLTTGTLPRNRTIGGSYT